MNKNKTILQILFGEYYLGIIILIIMVFLKDDVIVAIFKIIVGILIATIIAELIFRYGMYKAEQKIKKRE